MNKNLRQIELDALDREKLLNRLYHVLFWSIGEGDAREVTAIISLLTKKDSPK